MIGIAFNMDHLGRDVFSFIAERMNDDTATYGTVRTGAASFSGAVDF
jgi:hypothetical protein